LVQVGTELVDADQIRVRPARPAMTALVPEDEPGSALEPGPLVVPDIEVQRVAVAEDDRHGRILGACELHVQRQAVVGDDRQPLSAIAAGGLAGGGAGPDPPPPPGVLPAHPQGAGPARPCPGGEPTYTGWPPPANHHPPCPPPGLPAPATPAIAPAAPTLVAS